jgi:plastocyanin
MRLCAMAVIMLALLGSGVWTVEAAETHEVIVTSAGFEPSELTVRKGDTVRWIWDSGTHTVTSGKAPDEEDAGKLLDLPIDAQNDLVEYTFDETGVFDYFSRTAPDIRGQVTIQDGTPVDPATWGYLKRMFERP